MFASDFYFDGQYARDYNLVICSFDSEFETATGGEIEFNVVKSPDRDTYDFYGSEFNQVLVWKFSIMKNPCFFENDKVFSEIEERRIRKWLTKLNGYRWFSFCQDNYDVFYNVYINVASHQQDGETIGFDLTITSNCGYGFSNIITKEIIINSSKSSILHISNDLGSYIFPKITVNGSGSFYLNNKYDTDQNIDNGKETRLNNISSTIILDSDNDIITGLNNMDNFNWYFLRLVDGMNEITTNSSTNITLLFEYREPRRVVV